MHNKNHSFQYIQSFDSLRGFAAFIVLLLHGSYGILKGGWIGVDLFFVLSGYLITSLLQKEFFSFGKISLLKFYARRALRLFPVLIICVVLCNLLWSYTALYPGADQLIATSGAVLYFTNLLKGNVLGNMSHLWSLSVEEHFYILWPVTLIFFALKMSFRKRILFLLSLILFVSVFKIVVFHFENELEYRFFKIDSNRFTLCRIDGIMMGALLAFSLPTSERLKARIQNKLISTGAILFLLACFIAALPTLSENNKYLHNGGFLLTNLLCVSTVLLAIKNPDHSLFSNKILCWLGKRSYGIYAYHFPVFLVLENFRHQGSMSNFLVITLLRFVISIALAALSYKYIEQPVLSFKKQYERERIVSVS